MRQISILSFTARGAALNRNLLLYCRECYPEVPAEGYTFEKYPFHGLTPISGLNSRLPFLFRNSRLLVFIGAAGIAVRGIAPFLEGKDKDPAVLTVDELGLHVISLLSGHLGGANAYCLQLADFLQAEPVITTATDLSGVFAVDLFAVSNSLAVTRPETVKEISGRLLDGRPAGFLSRVPVEGKLPAGLVRVENGEEAGRAGLEAGICLSYDPAERPFPVTCHLLPRELAVGIGCRAGKTAAELEAFLRETFRREGLDERRICGFYSVDKKRGEAGLWELAQRFRVPFLTYTADELAGARGVFASSDFVEQTVGIENVCERSAVLGSAGGALVLRKTAAGGITLAAACRRRAYQF